MLTIRLARVGKKNKAQYKIVLQEHTVAPGGRHVEVLGSHDPHLKKTQIKGERAKYWISEGAQMSDTAYNLLVSQGVISGEKRKVKLPVKKIEEGSLPAAEAEAKKSEEKPEVEEKPAEETKKN